MGGSSFDAAVILDIAGEDLGQCYRCCQDFPKAELKPIGKSGKLCTCTRCNALEMRISRIRCKRGELAKDWATLSKEEKEQFMASRKL